MRTETAKTVRRKQQRASDSATQTPSPIDTDKAQKRLEWIFLGLLLIAGIYLAVTYWGQKKVPSSDFTDFVSTGDALLHFQLPSSFKRLPVLGVLQVALGKLMFGSPYPAFTGGLLLNGILYTLSLLLFYRVCRFFLQPTASFCLCLVAGLNPYTVSLTVTPIAETAIVFFTLLTLYLILKRSRWCYLAAMLASMTRYECFLLIGVAFLYDWVDRKTLAERARAFGLAVAAAVPMMLWMIGTSIKDTSQSNYIHHFLDVEQRNGFKLLKVLWHTSFAPLLQWPDWIKAVLLQRPITATAAEAIRSEHQAFQTAWNVAAAVVFIAGTAWAFLCRRWRFLGTIGLFWAMYMLIHMSQRVLLERYTVPVIWLTLLWAAYGLCGSVGRLAPRIPKGILYGGCILGGALAFLWTLQLLPAVAKTASISPASATVAYAGLLLAAAGLLAKQVVFRRKHLLMDLCLFPAIALMIVSNQFPLSFELRTGDKDLEFRMLAEWHMENAQADERVATSMSGIVNLFLPEGRKKAVHTGSLPGKNLAEFAETCRQRNIHYVAWDSRLGLTPNDEFYKLWGLEKIQPLGSGRSIGPFTYIKKLEANPRGYLLLYRFDEEKMPPRNTEGGL